MNDLRPCSRRFANCPSSAQPHQQRIIRPAPQRRQNHNDRLPRPIQKVLSITIRDFVRNHSTRHLSPIKPNRVLRRLIIKPVLPIQPLAHRLVPALAQPLIHLRMKPRYRLRE